MLTSLTNRNHMCKTDICGYPQTVHKTYRTSRSTKAHNEERLYWLASARPFPQWKIPLKSLPIGSSFHESTAVSSFNKLILSEYEPHYHLPSFQNSQSSIRSITTSEKEWAGEVVCPCRGPKFHSQQPHQETLNPLQFQLQGIQVHKSTRRHDTQT